MPLPLSYYQLYINCYCIYVTQHTHNKPILAAAAQYNGDILHSALHYIDNYLKGIMLLSYNCHATAAKSRIS